MVKHSPKCIILLLTVLLLTACLNQKVTDGSSSSPTPQTPPKENAEDTAQTTVSANFTNIDTYFMHDDTLYFADNDNGRTIYFTYDLSQNLLRQKDWRDNRQVRKTIPLSVNERLDVEKSGNEYILSHYVGDAREELTRTLKVDNGQYFVRTSPDHSHIYWIETMSGSDLRFVVYRIDDKHKTEIYTMDLDSLTYRQFSSEIQISPDGEKFLVKPYIYISSTGTKQWRLPAAHAAWAKGENMIAYVDEISFNKLYLFDPMKGETSLLFELPEGIITDQLHWDDSAQFVAFATGIPDGNEYRNSQVHIMDIRGGYHHIENEGNSGTNRIAELHFSPDTALLSYGIGAEMKVVHLPTGQAQVVIPEFLHAGDRYMIYASKSAFYLENNQIMLIDRQFRPKPLYQSTNRIFDFYYSEALKKLVVLEEGEASNHLKVINLQDQDLTRGIYIYEERASS